MAGSPTIASLFPQRVVIGVGDLGVSNNTAITLSTYALGSCVAVVAYDPAGRVGGLLHFMLPEAALAPDRAAAQPAMFADTGLPLLFRSLGGLKAERARLRLYVAGGANMLGSGPESFRIGERNIKATAAWLNQHGFSVTRTDVGGTVNRTVHLEIGTGALTLKTPAELGEFSLAA